MAVMALNLVSVIFFTMGQGWQNKWFNFFKKNDRHRKLKVSGFKSRDRYVQYIVQICMLMVSPIPYVDYEFVETYYDRSMQDIEIEHVQYLSEYIMAVMFLFRGYFVFKSRFSYSRYTDPFSKQICKDNNFYPSNWFIFKVKNEKKPLKTVVITSICLILGIWWWLLLFELQIFVTSD